MATRRPPQPQRNKNPLAQGMIEIEVGISIKRDTPLDAAELRVLDHMLNSRMGMIIDAVKRILAADEPDDVAVN